MIKLVLSTDIRGFAHNATVLASILRRTESPVSVRVYTRGFSFKNFEAGQLHADFIRCDEEVSGRYPGHVNPAVFDRLRIIRDFDDWDRVLVVDHDMLVFTDLAEYFQEAFDGALLMGRLFGQGNTIGMQLNKRGGLPDGWEHCANYPYFYMGPMMNLEAMRSERTWDRLLEAHAAIGHDEQVSLTAACGGRIKGVDKKWNLVPSWDQFEEASLLASETPDEETVISDIRWRRGIPEGLVHWTGFAKPWHYRSKVWRADLWDTELCGWEQLKAGTWRKPISVEVEPGDLERAKSLLRRGWKVVIGPTPTGASTSPPATEHFAEPYPDLDSGTSAALTKAMETAELIRFGPSSSPESWLRSAARLPERIVIEGPRDACEIDLLRGLGYLGEARIARKKWPAGGPHPKVHTYSDPGMAVAVASHDDLYLSSLKCDHQPGDPASEPTFTEQTGWQVSEELESFIRDELPGILHNPLTVLEFGPGRSTRILAETFPDARIVTVEHDAEHFRYHKHRLSGLSNVEVIHAPIDPSLPWYDLSKVQLPNLDLVLVDGPPGRPSVRSRLPAVSLVDLINPNGLVILDDTHRAEEKADRAEWEKSGLESLREAEQYSVLRRPAWLPRRPTALAAGKPIDLATPATPVYVISLPERTDRLAGLKKNWLATSMDHGFEVVDGIRPKQSEIQWQEMKGMEAYGRSDLLRGEYVIGAVGCKRAGIQALRKFIESEQETALICQDDCRWYHGAPESIRPALAELPDDWDMVYFSASARKNHEPYSPRLVRLRGARLCTAILWRRRSAIEALARLEECDCEMDLMLQRLHAEMNAYCVVPMPAFQARSFSNIIGEVVKPANR